MINNDDMSSYRDHLHLVLIKVKQFGGAVRVVNRDHRPAFASLSSKKIALRKILRINHTIRRFVLFRK